MEIEPSRMPGSTRSSVPLAMKSPIDLNSFAFGAALIAALVALSVAAATGTATGPRFQVSAWGFASDHGSGHGAYVVDTMSGEVWVVREAAARRRTR